MICNFLVRIALVSFSLVMFPQEDLPLKMREGINFECGFGTCGGGWGGEKWRVGGFVFMAANGPTDL